LFVEKNKLECAQLSSIKTDVCIGYQKRRIGMSAQGFHGDTFSDGFGGFQTMRKRQQDPVEVYDYPEQFLQEVQIDKVAITELLKDRILDIFQENSGQFI
jgi:hypothetical protein